MKFLDLLCKHMMHLSSVTCFRILFSECRNKIWQESVWNFLPTTGNAHLQQTLYQAQPIKFNKQTATQTLARKYLVSGNQCTIMASAPDNEFLCTDFDSSNNCKSKHLSSMNFLHRHYHKVIVSNTLAVYSAYRLHISFLPGYQEHQILKMCCHHS